MLTTTLFIVPLPGVIVPTISSYDCFVFRMLLNVSGTDFNFFVLRVDLWAVLQEPLYDLNVPCPHSNSGKRTMAYSATKLFNDLSSDLKEFSISSSPLIFKFLPSSLKSKLRSLFFSRLSSAEHLEDLLCSTCRYSIHCYCFS